MKNTVELIGYYGSDETHACSAWTSTSRELTPDKRNRIPALLKMLAENGHHTPFEKSSLHFLVNTDVASHIHLLKHRVGVSLNAESARYKEIKDNDFYLPEDWKNARCSVDFGFKGDTIGAKWVDLLESWSKVGNQLYHQCLIDIEPIVGRKRAKESARYFKTYNSQLQADIMFNFRSFVHFQKLRNSPDAQVEIRDVAAQMLSLVKQIEGNPFEYTLKAFGF